MKTVRDWIELYFGLYSRIETFPFVAVVQVQVLLADINDFAKMNDVYKEYFKSNFPARAAYQVYILVFHFSTLLAK